MKVSIMIGYAFCGSFCTLSHSLAAFRRLHADGVELQPIFSERVYETDTRFWRAEDFRATVEALAGRSVIHSIVDAEPLGPANPLDYIFLRLGALCSPIS